MNKWFRKNKRIFAIVVAALLAFLLLFAPIAGFFM